MDKYVYIWMHFFTKPPELKRCTPKGYAGRICLDGWTQPTQQEIDNYDGHISTLAYD